MATTERGRTAEDRSWKARCHAGHGVIATGKSEDEMLDAAADHDYDAHGYEGQAEEED